MDSDLFDLLAIGLVAVIGLFTLLALMVRQDLAPRAGLTREGRWLLTGALGTGLLAFSLKMAVAAVLVQAPGGFYASWLEGGREASDAGEAIGKLAAGSASGVSQALRSLARDLALALDTVGHVTMLRRLKAGPFRIEQAISLDKLEEVGKGAPLENVLLPLEAGLVDIPALDLGPEQARAVRQGRVLTGLSQDNGLCWARAGNIPVALMEVSSGEATVVRGFNLPDVAE